MEEELERDGQQFERRRGLASLPDDAGLNRILEYQSRTDKGLYKSLHELQRLQAGRQSGRPLIPAAVDVTVNVDASTPDGTMLNMDLVRGPVAAEVGFMGDGGGIAGDDPAGQWEAPEILQPSETEAQQRSADVRLALWTPKRKGLTINGYVGEADWARLLAQCSVREACDGDSQNRRHTLILTIASA